LYLFVAVILGSQGHIEGGLGGFFHDGSDDRLCTLGTVQDCPFLCETENDYLKSKL
jgi:hypothetical protein